MARLRIAVLMGGSSAERAVSLSTGQQVLAALDPQRYDAFAVDTAYLAMPALSRGQAPGPHGGGRTASDALLAVPAPPTPVGDPPLMGRNRPDLALICLHGRHGEDGAIQGMLELLGIPYTGSGILASALAMDKVMAKKILVTEGILTPGSLDLRGREDAERLVARVEAGEDGLPLPVIVKPNNQGSTIGVSVVRRVDQLRAALDTALAYSQSVLVEQFIEGVEVTAPVLGNESLESLPIVEIVPGSGFYDYDAKYTPGATDEICPARLPAAQAAAIADIACRCHRALGCRGFSRTDMIVAPDGVYVLEVNTIPGMTPTSLLPRSALTAGISFPELLDRMIQLALEGTPISTSSELSGDPELATLSNCEY